MHKYLKLNAIPQSVVFLFSITFTLIVQAQQDHQENVPLQFHDGLLVNVAETLNIFSLSRLST